MWAFAVQQFDPTCQLSNHFHFQPIGKNRLRGDRFLVRHHACKIFEVPFQILPGRTY